MDGEAIMAVFSMSTGIDSLKDILPKFGQRIKVFKSLKDAINQTMVQEVSVKVQFMLIMYEVMSKL